MKDKATDHYWAEPFTLPSEERQEIVNLIGEKSIVCVENTCQDYLGFSEAFERKPARGEINKKLRELHKCATKIALILADDSVTEELDFLVQEQYPPIDFVQRNNAPPFQSLAGDMQLLESATKKIVQKNRGRPKGSSDEAAQLLAYELYYCCKAAGRIPTIINGPAGPGLLHKILDLLRGPLNIDHGGMTGIFSTVIKTIQRERE